MVYILSYIGQKRHDLFARQPSSKAISDVVLEIRPFLLHIWNKRHEYDNFDVQLVRKFPILTLKIKIESLLGTH